jgi:shikimate dehydrogenase
MKKFGLIGYPLAQSFSQKYFSNKFTNEDIDAQYLNFPIPDIREFTSLINDNPELAGMNVTIPYKEQVMQYLNDLDDVARDIAAVNVIRFIRDGNTLKLKGYNTDNIGFTKSLLPFLKPKHTQALILGTGGAAKSVAYSLNKLGIKFLFVSRNPKNGNEISYESLDEAAMNTYKLIINTSPLGMFPNVSTCPDIPYQYVGKDHLFYDLVYNPEITTFLSKGAENGAVIKNGLEMLHIQADEAWKIWNS